MSAITKRESRSRELDRRVAFASVLNGGSRSLPWNLTGNCLGEKNNKVMTASLFANGRREKKRTRLF